MPRLKSSDGLVVASCGFTRAIACMSPVSATVTLYFFKDSRTVISRNSLFQNIAAVLAASVCLCLFAQSPKPDSVNNVLAAYTSALGGAAAIDRIATREVRGTVGLNAHVTYYWQKPNKVLRIGKRDRVGFDGSSGWIAVRRGRTRRLGRDAGEAASKWTPIRCAISA